MYFQNNFTSVKDKITFNVWNNVAVGGLTGTAKEACNVKFSCSGQKAYCKQY